MNRSGKVYPKDFLEGFSQSLRETSEKVKEVESEISAQRFSCYFSPEDRYKLTRAILHSNRTVNDVCDSYMGAMLVKRRIITELSLNAFYTIFILAEFLKVSIQEAEQMVKKIIDQSLKSSRISNITKTHIIDSLFLISKFQIELVELEIYRLSFLPWVNRFHSFLSRYNHLEKSFPFDFAFFSLVFVYLLRQCPPGSRFSQSFKDLKLVNGLLSEFCIVSNQSSSLFSVESSKFVPITLKLNSVYVNEYTSHRSEKSEYKSKIGYE